jgi:phospholipid/cholesterol/gamma-HCH transport system ATP-binding protein
MSALVSASGVSTVPFIRTEALRKTFSGQAVLDGITLDIMAGETFTLIGRSGEGKSVFTRHILGLMEPDSGRVLVDGVDIHALPERQLAVTRRKIGVLFQNGALFDSLSVAENVAFPLHEAGCRDANEIRERVAEALDSVGMAAHIEKNPLQLSGGQRKRVALARAVVGRPVGIVYDEPTSGLDPVTTDSISHLIRRIQARYQVTSIVITHDMKVVHDLGGRVAFLHQGQLRYLGPPSELAHTTDPVLRHFIEGRSLDDL